MKRVIILTTVFLGVLHLGTSGLFAQQNSVDSELRSWSISFYLGGGIGGPGRDIEDAMKATGFGKTSPAGFFGPGKSHPFSRLEKPSWMVRAKYYLKNPFSVDISITDTHLGETLGYHDQASFLFIDYSVFTVAPTISINPYDVITIGIGPAVCIAKAEKTSSGGGDNFSHTKIGFVLDAGLRTSAKTGFFGELSIQYRKVGKAPIGPFTAAFFNNTAVLPAAEVSYDHWFVGLGGGLCL
jgi:opacity protein-like surface antigen